MDQISNLQDIRLWCQAGYYKLDIWPDTKLDIRPDTKLDIQPDTKLDIWPDTKLDIRPDTKLNIRLDTKLDIWPDTKLDIQPDTRLDIQSDTKLDIRPDTRRRTNYLAGYRITGQISGRVLQNEFFSGRIGLSLLKNRYDCFLGPKVLYKRFCPTVTNSHTMFTYDVFSVCHSLSQSITGIALFIFCLISQENGFIG